MLCHCCGAPATLLATCHREGLLPFDVLLCERCRDTMTDWALGTLRMGLLFIRPIRPAPDGWKCPTCGG